MQFHSVLLNNINYVVSTMTKTDNHYGANYITLWLDNVTKLKSILRRELCSIT